MSTDNSNRDWRVPPELDTRIPRRIRLNGIGIARCVIAAACLAFAVYETTQVMNPALRRQTENENLTRKLAAEGRDAEAIVTHLSSGLGYVAFFDYTVDGRNYHRGSLLSSEHWKSLAVGSPLAIRYLPSDPSKVSPAADPPNSQNNWGTASLLVGMVWFFMLWFAGMQLSVLFAKRRLLARGLPIRGIVTHCKEGTNGRSSGYFLNYDFSLPDGSLSQGKAFRRYPEVEGSDVTVLYDHSQPHRNTLYPPGRCVWELVEPRVPQSLLPDS